MNIKTKLHSVYGECLYADNGIIEIAVPLSFGIRIGHFSFLGERNVFFEQPNDLECFNTSEGWRIRGGHRLWIAPEQTATYFPDNEPITYEIKNDEIILTQKEDFGFNIIKRFKIRMEDNKLYIIHEVINIGNKPLNAALWAISAMAAGGTEIIQLKERCGGFDPLHRLSFWDHTNPGDSRVIYNKDKICLKHRPISDKYKIGVGHPISPIRYELDDTVFVKHFQIMEEQTYPDGNVSYETFMSEYMVELESLSPMFTVLPNEKAEHMEVWELCRK